MFFTIENNTLRLNANLNAQALKSETFSPLSALPKALSIDASQVKQCDSVGIAALVWLMRQALAQHVALSWHGLPSAMVRLLKLYDLYHEGLIIDARRQN